MNHFIYRTDNIFNNSIENMLVSGTKTFIESFRNAKILILGSSGFIGNHLVKSFDILNTHHKLNIEIIAISKKYSKAYNEINKENQTIYRMNFDQFITEKPLLNEISHIFHCSTPANLEISEKINYEVILQTELLFKNIRDFGKTPNFIHLSSGAVYGLNARKERTISLDTEVANLKELDNYGKLKLQIEKMVVEKSEMEIILGSNPRLFTFYGPGFDLESRFAIANFMKDGMQGKKIQILGNPNSMRSYMFTSDLVITLLRVATNPTLDTFHVGSNIGMKLYDVAFVIGELWGVECTLREKSSKEVNFYVPETKDNSSEIRFDEGLEIWKKSLGQNKIEI